jgi:23S rRNA-intervening sequence protein
MRGAKPWASGVLRIWLFGRMRENTVLKSVALRIRPNSSGTVFSQFLKVAKGSAGEARAQLYAAKDRSLLGTEEFDRFFAMIMAIGKMLRRLRESLPLRTKDQGPRTKDQGLRTDKD